MRGRSQPGSGLPRSMNTGAKLESPNTILPPNRARTLAIAASATEDPAVMAVAADIQRLRSDSDDAAERLLIMPLLIPPPGKHVENCGDSHDPRQQAERRRSELRSQKFKYDQTCSQLHCWWKESNRNTVTRAAEHPSG